MNRDPWETTRILMKRKWVVVLPFLAAIGTAIFVTARMPKVYEAYGTLFVGHRQIAATELTQGVAATQLSQQLVRSYAQVVSSRSIAEAAIRRFDLPTTAGEIQAGLRVLPVSETQVISIAYRTTEPALASRVVNAVAQAFVQESAQLETPSATSEPAVKVSIVDRALTPTVPVAPNPLQNAVLGGLLGLAAGVGLAFILDKLDVTIKGKEDVDPHAGAPVLASIPKIQMRRDELYLEGDNQSVFAETFRKLRTAIQLYGADAEHKTVLVTSPRAREGKSTTAINLAAVFAYSGSRTILVEADMRRPKLHEHYSTSELNGFTLALLGRIPLERATMPTSIANLSCIPAGAIPPNPAELLGSRKMRSILDELQSLYDVVVIDAPPLLPVADTTTLAPRVDGVLLVAKTKQTRRDELKESVDLVRNVGGNVLGIALNAVEMDLSGEDYSYYDAEVRARARRGPFARR